MKSWEIIADNLSKGGWSWGWVSALDLKGRTIWIVDTHRDDGNRFIVRADEKFYCVFGIGKGAQLGPLSCIPTRCNRFW